MTKEYCNTKSRKAPNKISQRDFIERAKAVYGDAYTYDRLSLEDMRSKVVITCKIHGDFIKRPDHFLRGSACPRRSGMYSIDRRRKNFLVKSKRVHQGKYDYRLVKYVNSNTPVEIVCPIHGVFLQKPNDHAAGKSCFECGELLKQVWTREGFVAASTRVNDGEALLYVIECALNGEKFFKVGITSYSVKFRFRSHMPYDYKVLYEINDRGGCIYDLEKRLHSLLAEHQYTPSIKFGGHTECFTTVKPADALLISLTKEVVTQ